jgi:hypothetical protein
MLGCIRDMIVLDNFAGGIELPRVAFEGKQVRLAPRCDVHIDEDEDFIPGFEEGVRIKAVELQGRQRFEETADIFATSTRLVPWDAFDGGCRLPFDVLIQPVEDRIDLTPAECGVDLLSCFQGCSFSPPI